MSERRFIEEHFPIQKISEISGKEKSIRHKHISTLHIWWARRPMAASRATIFTSLISEKEVETKIEKINDFVIELSRWENSLNLEKITSARDQILRNNKKKPPKILDPFAGGGSIPFEALRLGCETYAQDYNPVAALILKCSIEYPQKYGKTSGNSFDGLHAQQTNPFLKDVQKWGKWIYDEANKELKAYYPDDNSFIPVAYIWSRIINCQNSSCGAKIPLMRQYLLAKKKDQIVSLYPVKIKSKNQIEFKIIDSKREKIPSNFDPLRGSLSKAIATCFFCGSRIDSKMISKLFLEKKDTQQLVAVIYNKDGYEGKLYKEVNEKDLKIFQNAETRLQIKIEEIGKKLGMSPIPDEDLPPKGTLGFRIQRYNMKKWGDIYNSRQKLSMITFVEKVRQAYDKMLSQNYDKEYAKAIATYLALAIDRLADFGSTLCILNPTGGRGVVHTFGMQVVQMGWTYAESNPLNPFGAGWITACKKNEEWIEHVSNSNTSSAKISNSSATSLPYQDSFFDAVFTDPPYYDNIAYSYLSDYFYVWLKRSIGYLYPELFSTPLTPKSNEVVAHYNPPTGFKNGKQFFEQMLKKSFSEIYRVLKPQGIAVIVYAHKSTEGWETLINSLLDSGLVVTAAWPINTEMRGRLRATDSAALASSIYMVTRKQKKEPIEFYREVKKELKQYLHKKLDQLWDEGISGADFFISGIGSAIEVFGKYERVVDDSDNKIPVLKLLDDTREIVTNYAIRQVLHSEFTDEISQMTRFYILWRWAYGEAKVPFDDARKMAQSVGIDLENEWNKGFITKDKEYIRVIGPDERKIEELEDSHELIDILHHTLLLWRKNKKEDLETLLQDKGYSKSDMFKRIGQAISESLPIDSTEKKWLDGFLTGFRVDDSQTGVQTKLF